MRSSQFIVGIISLTLSSHVSSSPIYQLRRDELFNRGLYSTTHAQDAAVMTLTVTPTVAGSTVPVTICVDLQGAGDVGTPSVVPCPMMTTSKTAADTTSAPLPTTSTCSPPKKGCEEVPTIGGGTGNPPISYPYSSSWYNFPTTATAPNSHSTHTSVPSSTSRSTTSSIASSSTGSSTVSTTYVPDATSPLPSTATGSETVQTTSQPMSSALPSTTSSFLGTSTLTSNTEQSLPTIIVNITTKTVYLPPTSMAITSTTSHTTIPTTTSATYPNWNSTLPSFSTITKSVTTSITVTSSLSSSTFTPSVTNSPPSTTFMQSTTQTSTSTTSSVSSTSSPTTQPSTMTYPSFSSDLPSFTTILPETSTSQAITSTYAPAPPQTEVSTTSSTNPLVVIPVTDAAPVPTGIELIPIGS